MELQGILAVAAAVCLVCVHLFAEYMRFLDVIPRSRWLSMAGGVSVAYVFIRLLPELGRGQSVIGPVFSGGIFDFIENHIYLIALTGLVVFYGLERLGKMRRFHPEKFESEEHEVLVFWLHIVSFSLYNLLIGYLLLTREHEGMDHFLWFFIAMALHFLVTDYGLRKDHRSDYSRSGRWVLSAALFIGVLLGFIFRIPEYAISILVAFLSGGIILNVLKEELPEDRKSRFSAFLLGSAGYTILLLLV